MTTVTVNPFSAVGPVKPMNAVNNGPVVARSEQSRGNLADFRALRVPFANSKIGPAAPPVKTPRGWLATFHAVRRHEAGLYSWEGGWRKEYLAGLMLLDLEDPSKVIGLSCEPLLAPASEYETRGFRGGVIFLGGMILEDDGEVKIYYGAADTVECLATAHLADLLAAVEPFGKTA